MSADIVNLNQYRKARAKSAKSDTAAGNRQKFGRTKMERLEDARARRDGERDLDGKKLNPDAPGDDHGKPA